MNGLVFPECAGSIVILGLGYGLERLSRRDLLSNRLGERIRLEQERIGYRWLQRMLATPGCHQRQAACSIGSNSSECAGFPITSSAVASSTLASFLSFAAGTGARGMVRYCHRSQR
ncbi:MAG TPA: hypothetical protein VE175_01515 [Woeseiaceae bacterium]|nr:hypothetical protein [Woeseiaceae bacterium]